MRLEIFTHDLSGPESEKTDHLKFTRAFLQGLKDSRYQLDIFTYPNDISLFLRNPLILGMLMEQGVAALPVVMIDGQVRCRGSYPNNDELADLAVRRLS